MHYNDPNGTVYIEYNTAAFDEELAEGAANILRNGERGRDPKPLSPFNLYQPENGDKMAIPAWKLFPPRPPR